MRTFSTLLLAGLLSFFVAGRGYAQWVQTSLDSSEVLCFAVSASNLYAGTDGSGIVRSTDNGATWQKADAGLIGRSPTIGISGSNILVGSYGGLYLSTDIGISWHASGLSSWWVNVVAFFGSKIFAGAYFDLGMLTRLFLSTDNGASWREADSGFGGYADVYSLVAEGSGIYAGTLGQGVFVSSDSGASWRPTGLTTGRVRALAVSGSHIFAGEDNNGGIYVSMSGGMTWQSADSGLTNKSVISFAASGPFVFAGTEGGGVFLSTDGGTSWSTVDTGLTDTFVSALTISGTNVLAGTGSGVWRRPLSEMITSVHPSLSGLPKEFKLDQNYPNPFNPTATISYSLPQKSFVTLKLYDLLGREVRILVNGEQEPGNYSRIVDANDLPSGVYFYRLQAGKFTDIKKMLMVK